MLTRSCLTACAVVYFAIAGWFSPEPQNLKKKTGNWHLACGDGCGECGWRVGLGGWGWWCRGEDLSYRLKGHSGLGHFIVPNMSVRHLRTLSPASSRHFDQVLPFYESCPRFRSRKTGRQPRVSGSRLNVPECQTLKSYTTSFNLKFEELTSCHLTPWQHCSLPIVAYHQTAQILFSLALQTGTPGGVIRTHRELSILVQLQCHPFLHLLSRNCFLLFVAWKINFDTFRHKLWFLASSAVFKDLKEESGINFLLRSAYIGHLNKKWCSFSISFMQKAQFLSRDKTLYRCKLLFNGSTPNLACDTATLKQYISVFETYFSFSKIVLKDQ